MPVSSAQELNELIKTLSTHFQHDHQPMCNTLYTQADLNIQHVLQEGEQWITAEIHQIINEWQEHLNALKAAEAWFSHHVPNLDRIAEDAIRLSTESMA